jgi:putative transposase
VFYAIAQLDGQTPLGRWREDTTPPREVPAEALRWMLMADVERTINKDGARCERSGSSPRSSTG